jgi:NADH-quinone oxidoreductase subunit G
MIMHAADKAGSYIPHFCYHKKLSIAANCRMCLVDVEKAPKPMPACATPVTNGMIVRTRSEKAIKAQQSVMEFLLINHPLDCPICDQGGECQLQDLAVGYGASASRYEEEKRVVLHKDVGPLISMEEMSRCIHCTRCVRFGQEVAGVMELGMIHRGEHSRDHHGAGRHGRLRSLRQHDRPVPGRRAHQQAVPLQRPPWELSRRKSVSPHDSTGANLIVQVKNNKVLRVLPLENDAVNECWLADRDRFSYEALNTDERLTAPMLKQGGEWKTVDWQTALEYVANGLKQVKDSTAPRPSARWSARTARWRNCSWPASWCAAWAARTSTTACATPNSRRRGRALARHLDRSLSTLQRALVIGSNLRKDHPLFALRVRAAVRSGAQVSRDPRPRRRLGDDHRQRVTPAGQWLQALADVATAIGAKGRQAPLQGNATDAPRPSPSRCCPASARRSCWATPPRTTRTRPRCWRWPTGSASRPAPPSATSPKPPTPSARSW